MILQMIIQEAFFNTLLFFKIFLLYLTAISVFALPATDDISGERRFYIPDTIRILQSVPKNGGAN
jgi:hypothetical protein